MALEYFPCFYSYRKKIAKLSDQEVGRLFRRLLEYGETGEAEELTGREAVAFDFIADDIDRAKNEYDKKCASNKKSIEARYECIRTNTNVYERSQTETEDKTEDKTEYKTKSSKEDNKKSSRFSPPTLEEVKAYCFERHNGVDPEQFIAFYTAKGWKVGNQPMKDWKAAVITWEKRDNKNKSSFLIDSIRRDIDATGRSQGLLIADADALDILQSSAD